MAVKHYDFFVKGNAEIVVAYLDGFLRGKGVRGGYLFTEDLPFQTHSIKEYIKFHGDVVHLICRASQQQASGMHAGHDELFAVGETGCFQLFAKNAQEVADLTLIAHRIAELALAPVVVAQDMFQTSHALHNVLMPEQKLAERYLGRPDDRPEVPTASQRMLFGKGLLSCLHPR